jgi:hypothetical protein
MQWAKTNSGFGIKTGRRSNQRPKSREETPKEGHTAKANAVPNPCIAALHNDQDIFVNAKQGLKNNT